MVLLSRSAITMRQSPTEMRTYDLSKVSSFQMDKTTVYRWLGIMRRWFLPAGLTAMVVFSLIGRLILMLIDGAIGLIFNSGLGAAVPYPALMRLSALAMTPTLLLSTIFTLAGIPGIGCFWTIAGIVIVLTYLAVMVRANAQAFPPAPPRWMQPSYPGMR